MSTNGNRMEIEVSPQQALVEIHNALGSVPTTRDTHARLTQYVIVLQNYIAKHEQPVLRQDEMTPNSEIPSEVESDG